MQLREKFEKLRPWSKILVILLGIGSFIVLPVYLYPFVEREADYDITLEDPLYSISEVPIGAAVDVNKLRTHDAYRTIVETHFNSLTAENHMKWSLIAPDQNEFFWDDANYIVEFAEANNMIMHGHCLVWHEQLPQWVHDFKGTPSEWNETLKNHIQTVAAQYAGRIQTWDVVNEAFQRDGFRKTIWYQHLGADYIKNAFIWAHEADPSARLYYNDYNLLGDHQKLDRVLDHISILLAEGVPIHGIGAQAHITVNYPSIEAIQEAIAKIEALGLDLRISELDIQINPNNYHRKYTESLAEKQCQRYAEVTKAFAQSSALKGITTWGISDADSWIPYHTGRQEWVLLFDENYQPKPAALCFQNALAEVYT